MNNDWARVCIADVCESIIDCVNKTAPTVDEVTPFKMIRTTNVRDGWVSLESVKCVSEEVYRKWVRRQIPQRGDVILTREAPLGEAGIIRSDELVFLGQRLVSYRADPAKLDKHFLLYSFLSDDLQGQIRALGSGATVEHMRVPDAQRLSLRLPPLATQRRIASILSAYDDLIENNTRRIAILEEMARRLYQEWFVHFRFPGHDKVKLVESEFGKIPEGWEVVPLQDLFLLQRGFDLPKKQRQEGPYPVFASTGHHGSHVVAKAKGPGVVTGRSGSLGTVTYVPMDYWPLNTTLWVKEFRRVSPVYAFHVLSALGLEQFNGGAAVPTLNRNVVHRLPQVLSPQAILSDFDKIVQPVFDLKFNLLDKNANLRTQRDLLLPKLISGEIDVSTLTAPAKESEAA